MVLEHGLLIVLSLSINLIGGHVNEALDTDLSPDMYPPPVTDSRIRALGIGYYTMASKSARKRYTSRESPWNGNDVVNPSELFNSMEALHASEGPEGSIRDVTS